MAETALEKAQRKFEQARAALDAIKARESAEERKKDTRRKIVLGGALLELSKLDKEASALVSRLLAGLTREHDKKLFEKGAKKNDAAEPAKVEAQAPAIAPAPVAAKVEAPASEPIATTVEAPAAQPGVISTSAPEKKVSPSFAMPGYVPPQVKRDRERI